MLKNLFSCFALLLIACTTSLAQSNEYKVEVEEEIVKNRLFLHAVNKNLVDLDVSIEVEGTGFRQRKGIPRKVRIPATSKVNLISLIIERGQEPKYTYKLDISDQLSKRVITRPATPVKIDPKKSITIYVPENCTNCDSIITPLSKTPYKYKVYKIAENEGVRKSLERSFASSSRSLETIDTAIISLDTSMYLTLTTYEEMMAKVEEEKEK